MGGQLTGIHLVLLEEGFSDGFVDLIGCRRLLATARLGEPARPEIPLRRATPAQAILHIATWIHIQHHRLGHVIPAFFPEAGADCLEIAAAIEIRAEVIGEAAKGRLHQRAHLRPMRDFAADRLPVVLLQGDGQELVGVFFGDRLAGADASTIGIDGGAPADCVWLTAAQWIRVGMHQTVVGSSWVRKNVVTAFELLYKIDSFLGNGARHGRS